MLYYILLMWNTLTEGPPAVMIVVAIVLGVAFFATFARDPAGGIIRAFWAFVVLAGIIALWPLTGKITLIDASMKVLALAVFTVTALVLGLVAGSFRR